MATNEHNGQHGHTHPDAIGEVAGPGAVDGSASGGCDGGGTSDGAHGPGAPGKQATGTCSYSTCCCAPGAPTRCLWCFLHSLEGFSDSVAARLDVLGDESVASLCRLMEDNPPLSLGVYPVVRQPTSIYTVQPPLKIRCTLTKPVYTLGDVEALCRYAVTSTT